MSISSLLNTQLPEICKGSFLQFKNELHLTKLLTDSRKPFPSDGTVYFALTGARHNGHEFIQALYTKGVRTFVVEKKIELHNLPEANVLLVDSAITALQQVALSHRIKFNFPVIGVTGSNAKTIVKEWLSQLLATDYSIVKNPGSYNSQIGVPLSLWQINAEHTLGIFEAGISKPGEMVLLEKLIQPDIGIFTNIGTAHDEGFDSIQEKIEEKLKLFSSSKVLIYCADHPQIKEVVQCKKIETLSWGHSDDADIKIVRQLGDDFSVQWKSKKLSFQIHFKEKAMQENCMHCIALMLWLNISAAQINSRIKKLRSIPMRLELKRGIANTYIIDDTYNNDLAGLQIALDYLRSLPQKTKWLILSDIHQSGLKEKTLYTKVNALLKNAGVDFFIGIGPDLSNSKHLIETESKYFLDTASFLNEIHAIKLNDELILIKGARAFEFEQVVKSLTQKLHSTVLEINLSAVTENLNLLKSRLGPNVKTMAMVKAFAYGSGIEEIAATLAYHKVDSFGVAFADEGKRLRDHGIRAPIMVMNANEDSFEMCINYSLELEIFSLRMLESLISSAAGRIVEVHLKIETGMNRLGFSEADITRLIELLQSNNNLKVKAVFTHLAAADDPAHDDFTHQQIEIFNRVYKKITQAILYNPMRHVLNSAGIIRFPQYQFEMVRLGIALYGVNPTEKKFALQPALCLKSIVSQVKFIKQGEHVGYGRTGIANKKMKLATIAIGYADGFKRILSNGNGKVWIGGKLAPVIGNVCMDMCMVNVDGVEVKEGDEVIIFGKELPLELHSSWANTISYEIIAGISERVKRTFYTGSF